ncbi:MAG TPA: TetR family transcriptional regulator [Dermatophilaceae bacterium]|nr:TetR family transcriptional regulator [Dermatophilaceae bacterium]
MTSRAPVPRVPRRGRRAGGGDTRGTIVTAARVEFARVGYDAASLRSIARAAGVDPSLVHHYFDGKPDVFVAAMQLPVRPADLVAGVLAGPAEQVGVRLATAVLDVWEVPAARDAFLGLLRSAVSHEEAARMVREFMGREVFGRVAQRLQVPDPELRAGVAASQMIGLALMRFVIGFPPVARASKEQLVAIVAPTLQHYLVGEPSRDAPRGLDSSHGE